MYRTSSELPPLVITAHNGVVVALRTEGGAEAWRREVGGPTVRIAVTAERVVAAGSAKLEVLDYLTGAVVGSIPLRGATTTMLVASGRAFVMRAGEMICVDVEAGRVLWTQGLRATGTGAPAIGVPGVVEQGDRMADFQAKR